jgi:spore coat protein SA
MKKLFWICQEMHVCMISGLNPILPSPVGPIETYAYQLSKELSQKHFVDVIGCGHGHVVGKNIEITAILGESKCVSLFKRMFGNEYGQPVAYDIQLIAKICILHRKNPINLLHFNVIYSAPIGSIFKSIYDVPIVCSLHNTVKTARPLKGCDKILVNSRFLKSTLVERHHLDSNKIEVLPIPIEKSTHKPPEKDKAKLELCLSGYKVVLFVGRKCFGKGPQVLIEAIPEVVRIFPNVIALFVGPDYTFNSKSNSFTDFLKRRASELNIDKHVSFLGFTQGLALKKLFYAADVLVCPTIIEEAFGKVIIESMAANTPVIGSNIGGIPELIKHEKNGLLVPPNNINALSNAIIRVLENETFARFLAHNGANFVQEAFSIDVVGKRCLQIYENLT